VRFESIHEDKGNHQEQVGELIKQTVASIDDLALKMLFVTVQQNNLEVCIEHAVNPYTFLYNPTVVDLIYMAASWFGHCYDQGHNYGTKEDRRGLGLLGILRRDLLRDLGRRDLTSFVSHVHGLMGAQCNVPSLWSFIAIFICLEHSFWIVQQGSSSKDGFTMAWNQYFKTQHALVNQELDNYLLSKGSSDWFTMKHIPSEEECAECRKIVLNNLLSRPTIST